jgi:hypothetical protein
MLRQTVIAAFGFATMMVGANVGAHAQSTSLAANNSFMDNGWLVTITSLSCEVSQNGAGQVACGSSSSVPSLPSTDVLEVTGSGRNVSIALANSAGGSALQFTDGGTGNEKVDINYSISLQKVSNTTQNLNSLSAAVQGAIKSSTGAVDSTPYAFPGISDGASYSYVGANGTSGGTSLAYSTVTGIAGPATFTPSTSITLTQDISLIATPGSTLTFGGNTINAPEPATLVILTPVVLALVKARKSRKRQPSTSF